MTPTTSGQWRFDLRQQSAFNLSEQPPFINIQQFYIEGFLVERIAELGGVDLRWKSRVSGFRQHEGYATLTVDTPAGAYALTCDWLVAADGARSHMRAKLLDSATKRAEALLQAQAQHTQAIGGHMKVMSKARAKLSPM